MDEVADPVTGQIRLCAARCATCLFRPENSVDLRPGRLPDMVREAERGEGHLMCHKTLSTGRAAICRGFADADRGTSLALRFGQVLGTLREVTPPGATAVPPP